MNTVNLTALNNENFVFSRVVTDWATFFNLDAGVFKSQMRPEAGSPIVNYEWSTAKGNVAYQKIAAAGSVAFTTNPVAGTTLTIGASLITFVASGATGLQVNIGGNLAATLAALLTFLNASVDSQISQCTYALAGTSLVATFKTLGIAGNSFGLATTVAGATTSGSLLTPPVNTLSGGAVVVEMSAPLSDVSEFSGGYVYDFRFQGNDGTTFAVMFGGSLTFTQGITS